MDILEMIHEWRRGCSCALDRPSQCEECTNNLIDAIERKLLSRNGETIENYVELLTKSKKFYDDVMPQIGKLVIQDYENLNELAILLSKVKK